MLAALLVRGGFGFVYGALMAGGALVSAWGGHGTYLPSAVVAAPLSLIPVVGLFMAPIWWGLLAALTALPNRVPLFVLLALHLATVACLLVLGTPMEPGDEVWSYFWRALPHLTPWIRGTLVLHATAVVAVLAVASVAATAHSPDADDYLRGR
jgi:hypothetical protein